MEDANSPAGTIDEIEHSVSLVAAAEEVMDVQSIRRPLPSQSDRAMEMFSGVTIEITGRLRMSSECAYEAVSQRFRSLNHIALFRRSPDGEQILAIPGILPTRAGKMWLSAVLFVATLLSVSFVGALNSQEAGQDFSIVAGWPFAAALLAILVAHEMGHYVVARVLGVPISLPYFIPLPLPPLGTMGAVEQMAAPPKNRRDLLAVGAAGPLAGLIVSIPVLWLGLTMSNVASVPAGESYFQEGNSLLYAGLKLLVFGRFLPSGGQDVLLHPVALAGWAGLLVTALNLIPAGQLDGGHVLYSLFGERASRVRWIIIVALLVLSFWWTGWLIWAGMIYFLGRFHAVPLDDVTEPRRRECIFAIAMLVIAVLVFVPVPMNVF